MSSAAGKRTAILLAFNEPYYPIARVTVPILMRYADKHGYVVHGGDSHYKEDPGNLRDYGDRGKIDMFMQVYDEFEIVMFLDVDALIMNHAITIEDVLVNGAQQEYMGKALEGRSFLWSWDWNGPCSGFWIARCVPGVKQMFLTVQREAQKRGAVSVQENLGPPHSVTLNMEPRGTSDQTTMRSIMHLPPFKSILGNCVSLKEAGHTYDDFSRYGWQGLERYGQYEAGDWIVTAPGIPIDEKVRILSGYAERAG